MAAPSAREMHTVDGKVVIVTGSGKGIGKGMALHLGKGGARIVVAEWKDELLAQTCRELEELGITNYGVVCDIQQREQIDAMVAQTIGQFGRVDALINNAQTFRPLAPIAEVS
jgi:2-hydroxycyclohexanecarboxyl-CoA dehydrogenase